MKRNDLPVYGIDAELNAKQAAKYNPALEGQVKDWIADVTGQAFPSGSFQEVLKDGVLLCNLANKLQSGAIPNINKTKMAFKQMENINNFLEWTYSIGVNKADLFQTIDLYENQNIVQVTLGLVALSRVAAAKGLCSNHVGPKLADSNPRNFSEDVLNQSNGIVGLQMGYTGGANASGMNFGRRREIDELKK